MFARGHTPDSIQITITDDPGYNGEMITMRRDGRSGVCSHIISPGCLPQGKSQKIASDYLCLPQAREEVTMPLQRSSHRLSTRQ